MEWWKDAARTYAETRARLAQMPWAAYQEYVATWEGKAVRGMAGVPSATAAKWRGFHDALVDDLKRRENNARLDDPLAPGFVVQPVPSDDWLDGVLKYLYEEQEVPQWRGQHPTLG